METTQTRRRRTRHRVQTYAALEALANTPLDGGLPQVIATNSEIRDLLEQDDVGRLTLPAITARLQSLQTIGCIDIQYWLNERGHSLRVIHLLQAPDSPEGQL